jgi:hypothetical protein
VVFGRRDYDVESERQKGVEEFYRLQHINQTVDFVRFLKKLLGFMCIMTHLIITYVIQVVYVYFYLINK